jgi:hypothetical protein
MSAMRTWTMAVVGLPILTCAISASAYDAETHALIAYEAFKASTLSQTGPTSVVARLGLDRLDMPTPFNAYWQAVSPALGPVSYYDNAAGFDPTLYPRKPNEYERCQMQHLADFILVPPDQSWLFGDPMLNGAKVSFFPIQNWLMRGDLREDDISPLGYKFAPEKCGLPDQDPLDAANGDFVHGVRVVNHFYDPINDVPLNAGTGCGVGPTGQCLKSVDWALGNVDSFATPPVVDTARRNHFTYADARENMWRALTGERGIGAPPYTGAAHAADAQERIYRWATAFRSLGDVTHLLQDGAQPQHVRNDAHSPFTSGERQAYEGYTNARVIGTGGASVNSYVREFFAQPQQLTVPLVVTGNYPAVTFSTPLRFFTTRLKSDGPAVLPDARYGLMDYTNRSFFTGGTLPGSAGNAFLEPSATIDAAYTSISQPCVLGASVSGTITNLTCKHLMHAVPDSVTPGYVDELPHKAGQVSAFTAPPLLLESAFNQVVPGSSIPRPHQGFAVGLEEFQTMGNLTIPRAIGYSTGLLNYFFRGQITVSTPADKTIGVLNQGAQHMMNAQGYPCIGTATADGCAIFGFQYIRVNVLNTTAKIIESGTAAQVPQNLSGTSVGDVNDANFHGPYLVAVAKYHRNTCYKPDLTGQRVQSYAPIPQLIITEPTCAAGQVVRTAYQEISVSKSAAVTATALNGTTASEVKFDFTADPIPVNATDLFIQVVYRGPMGDATLGQEPDAIAVGTMDVREPTFLAFWDNTDYFWNGSWIEQYPMYPHESARDFWVCGSGAPPKLLFEYYGVPGAPAMLDPKDGSNSPGQVRLGIIYPAPVGASQFIGRGTPVAYPTGTEMTIPVRSTANSGHFQQANKENVVAATLTAPYQNCGSGLPNVSEYWCYDTVLKRRGQIFGRVAQPLYYFLSDDAGDVDAPPLPVFVGTHPLVGGTNRFNNDTTLVGCPGQPTSLATKEAIDKDMHNIEVLEEARDLGVSGEEEPSLQQRK